MVDKNSGDPIFGEPILYKVSEKFMPELLQSTSN